MYGYDFEATKGTNNDWYQDLNKIYNNLAVVSNQGETNVGGGGTPRDSNRITDLAYGVVKNVSNGTQIEAEDYNPGGDGTGYHDADSAQKGRTNVSPFDRDGGGAYRNDSVDVLATSDTDSGAAGNWKVGYTTAGEWLNYSVNVTTAGTYTIGVRAASGGSGGTLHFEDENGNRLGSVTVNGTGSSDTFQTFNSTSFSLSAGAHTLKLVEDTGGYDLNYFTLKTGLAAPTGVTGVAGVGKATLSWNPVSGATAYRIKRSTTSGSGYTWRVANWGSSPWSESGLTAGQTYYYVIAALDAGGNESPNSIEVAITPT